MTGTYFRFEVRPQIPEQLERLNELANDLLYSWDRNVRGLFFRLDPELWDSCGHNPRVFLRQVSQKNLEDALEDQIYMEDYNKVMFVYDNYHHQGMRHDIKGLEPGKDLVAYFCAEFGFHESLPIYSGGLGILAGDYCKAMSNLWVPFFGVGLLYRTCRCICSETMTALKCVLKFRSRGAGFIRVSGAPMPVASRSTCSIPTCRKTANMTAPSRTSSTAATATPVSSRKSC